METKLIILCLCLVLVSLVKNSAGLACYECGSLQSHDAKCEDPFKSSGIGSVSCSGSCLKAKGEMQDIQVVWRSCLNTTMENTCISKTLFGVDVDVCYCGTNMCNAASSSGVSYVALLAAAIFVIRYKDNM